MSPKQNPKPREGSPVARAIAALQSSGGPLREDLLAERIDQFTDEVGGLLAYGCRVGLLRRYSEGSSTYYALGDGSPAAPEVQAAPAPASAAPGAAPEPSVDDLTAEAFARELIESETPKVVVDELSKATQDAWYRLGGGGESAPGVNINAAHRKPGRPSLKRVGVPSVPPVPPPLLPVETDVPPITAVAEPVAETAAAPLVAPAAGRTRVATTLEAALYSDGRLLLEVDGDCLVLPQPLTAKLFRYLDKFGLEPAARGCSWTPRLPTWWATRRRSTPSSSW